LKTPGGVDNYPDVTVRYISGPNIDLVIDGAERIDLTNHRTSSQLHTLFASRGFRTTEDLAAEKASLSLPCERLASMGLCAAHVEWMRQRCADTCSKVEL